MSAEDINAALVEAAVSMAPVMTVTDGPLVSTDFNHDPASAVVHLDQTRVMPDGMTRVLAWYDNDGGFQTACWTRQGRFWDSDDRLRFKYAVIIREGEASQ